MKVKKAVLLLVQISIFKLSVNYFKNQDQKVISQSQSKTLQWLFKAK